MKNLVRFVALGLLLAITGAASADLLPRPRPRPIPTPYPYPVPIPVPVVPNQLPQPDPLPQRDPLGPFWAAKDVKFYPIPMAIHVDDSVKEARLEIPSAVFTFPASWNGADPTEQRAEAETSPYRTTVAGLALSLAFCTGGVWVVRRGGPGMGRMSLALLLTATASLAIFGTVLCANAQQGFRPAVGADGRERVTVEVKVKNEGQIKLIVSKKQLAKFLEQGK